MPEVCPAVTLEDTDLGVTTGMVVGAGVVVAIAVDLGGAQRPGQSQVFFGGRVQPREQHHLVFQPGRSDLVGVDHIVTVKPDTFHGCPEGSSDSGDGDPHIGSFSPGRG